MSLKSILDWCRRHLWSKMRPRTIQVLICRCTVAAILLGRSASWAGWRTNSVYVWEQGQRKQKKHHRTCYSLLTFRLCISPAKNFWNHWTPYAARVIQIRLRTRCGTTIWIKQSEFCTKAYKQISSNLMSQNDGVFVRFCVLEASKEWQLYGMRRVVSK